jgi:DNA-directed RNA polymerase subunit RPC12/RpoP
MKRRLTMTSIASGREQPCSRCGSKLVKAEWDEPVNEREVQHLWRCWNCNNEFVTVEASEDERTPETTVTEPFFTSLVIE